MKLTDYIRGDRRGREAHDLERRAMEDPLLSDALEGYDFIEGDHDRALERLKAGVASRARRSRRLKRSLLTTGIAAALALCIAWGGYMMFWDRNIDKSTIQIALVDTTTHGQQLYRPADEVVADSASDEQEVKDIKKYTPPVVGDASAATEEMVKMKDTDSGSRNIDASADSDIVIDERPVEHRVEQQIVEERMVMAYGTSKRKDTVPPIAHALIEDAIDYKKADQPPRFQNDNLEAFASWIQNKLRDDQTPLQTKRNIKITLSFIIEKDGSLTHAEVSTKPNEEVLTARIAEIMKQSPRWTPARKDGAPVRVKVVQQFKFEQ